MIWYLVFCTSVYGGQNCIQPIKFNNQNSCQSVLNAMVKVANNDHHGFSGLCVIGEKP